MGIGKTSIFVATGILQGLLNVAGNYALIFGNWGCPELGMWGAGLASMISAQIALMVMVGYALYQGLHRKHQFFRSLQPEWARIRALLNISTPMMIQGAASLSAYFLSFTVIEGFGLQAIAVSNILHGVYVLMMTATWGFNVATSTGVSTALGAGNEAIARRVVLRAGLLSLATTLVVCGLVWLSPIWLFGLFSKDQVLIEQAVLLSGVILWPILIYALSGVLFGAVSGTGATRAGLIIEVLMIVVYMVYMFGFVAPTGNLRLAWSAEWLYMFVMGLLSVLYLASGHWRRIKV
jgi:Na+-driven multidrug efflux pump